jgi:LytS/YehU family sensor histidine kinase
MGLVTAIYALIAGVVGGLIGAFIITLIRRLSRPKSNVGWDFLTFSIAFVICGLLCAAATILIMVQAFTGGF